MWILFSNGAKVFVSFPGSVARAFGVGLFAGYQESDEGTREAMESMKGKAERKLCSGMHIYIYTNVYIKIYILYTYYIYILYIHYIVLDVIPQIPSYVPDGMPS